MNRTIKLEIVQSGPPVFCEWCGRRKAAGDTHGQIKTRNGLAVVTCIAVDYESDG